VQKTREEEHHSVARRGHDSYHSFITFVKEGKKAGEKGKWAVQEERL